MRFGAHLGMKNIFPICETAKSLPDKKNPNTNLQGTSCKNQYLEKGKKQKLHKRVSDLKMIPR